MTRDVLIRLQRMDYLIRIKGTGKRSELACKLGLSERTVTNYLQLMRSCGAPIKFCNYRQSYYYEEEGCFTITFSFTKAADDQFEHAY